MRREAMIRAADAEVPMLRRPEDVPIVMRECPVCGGDGGKSPRLIGAPDKTCPRCRGDGEVPRILGGH